MIFAVIVGGFSFVKRLVYKITFLLKEMTAVAMRATTAGFKPNIQYLTILFSLNFSKHLAIINININEVNITPIVETNAPKNPPNLKFI